MTNREGWGETRNLAGTEYFAIKEIEVFEYLPLPDGEGDPTEVHMMITIEDFPYPIVMRFHSRRACDELIVALMTHSKAVWP